MTYKTMTLDDMMKYIDEVAPQDKEWFKEIAFQDKNGNTTETYQHLNARKKFCEKYMKELIPVAKPKAPTAKEKLENW